MLIIMNSDCKKIIWLILELGLICTQILQTESSSGPPKKRKLPLTMLYRNNVRRQTMMSASEPIIIKIGSSGSTGRRVPNMPHLPPESSIVRLKPVIRFHVPSNSSETSSISANELYETLVRMGLHRMASLLRDSQLAAELVKIGPITVFAPTDDAFSLSSRGGVETLQSEDVEKLKELLLYHVIRGHMYPKDVRNDFTMPTIHPSASPMRFNIYNGGQVLSASGAQFLGSWVSVGDILIQPIDRVLFPIPQSDIVQKTSEDFNRMYMLIRESGLIDQLSSGTFTVFCPTNEAFSVLPQKAQELLLTNSSLLRKFLLNHVVPGTYFSTALRSEFHLKPLGGDILNFATRRGLILVNGVPIVNPDVPAINGVIHAINRVLVPEELVDQCRCMSKYPLAPATLKPSPQLQNTTFSASHPDHIPTFGTRLKGLPQEDPDGTSQNQPDSRKPVNPVEDRPALVQLLSQSMQLPDGRTLTFDTAGQLFRKSVLYSRLRQPGLGGYTILLPTDASFKNLPVAVMQRLQRDPRRLAQVLRWHVLEGTINPSALKNTSRLKTLSGGTLLVNLLPGGKVLVGGVQILATRSAANGAVFAVDKVFDPLPENKDLSEGIQQPSISSGTDVLSIWRQIIDDLPDLKKQLKSRQQAYTMFAPTNAAFAQLPSDQLKQLLNEESLKRDIVRRHVLLGAYFRTMFSPGLELPTLMGNKLYFKIAPVGFQVNEVLVTKPGRLTSNGVVYVIDSLLPTSDSSYRSLEHTAIADRSREPFSRSLEEIARKYNATTFLKWIHASGLRNAVRNDRPCTLFLPTNDAIVTMSPTLRSSIIGNPKVLKRVVQYHICPYQVKFINDIAQQDLLLPTLLPKKTIRCNVYQNKTVVTASGCPVSAVEEPHDEVGVVVINRTLSPPVGNLFLTMSKSPMLRNFTKIVRVANIEEELQKEGGPYTIFAPSKCAFKRMAPAEYEKLITDEGAARAFVMRHVVRGCFYTSGISDGMTLTTMGGNELHFKTSDFDCITVNGKKLKFGDLSATNGVLHIVADIL